MAIHRRNEETGKNENVSGFTHQAETLTGFNNQAFEKEAQTQADKIQAEQSNSLHSIFAQNTSGPFSRQQGTARLVDMFDRASNMLKGLDERQPLQLTAIKADAQSLNLYLSSVVIVGRDRATPDTAYVYCLLLEREDTTEPEVRNNNGFKVVIPVVSGNAWDEQYQKTIARLVAQQTGLTEDGIRFIPPGVVGNNVPLHKENDTKANSTEMINMVYNAVFAINTRLKERTGISNYALSRTSANEVMTVEPKFSRGLVKDLLGREKRSDITLTFSLKQQNQKSQSLNGADMTSQMFGRMDGYIDFINVQSGNTQQNPWDNPNAVVNKKNPLFVITHMFTEQAGTVHAQLTMLMAAATMANRDEWVNSLYTRHQESKKSKEPIDIGEIGGLNIETNLPQYRSPDAQGLNAAFGPIIDTRVEDFDRNKYIQLVQQLCRQDMYVALDAPSVGAESWYTDRFRASAQNTDWGRSKANEIWQAAQDLTGDRFAKAFSNVSRSPSLWLAEPIVLHNGSYVNSQTNERRDIRDIDSLAIANVLGANDPTAPARWDATFEPGADVERALTIRKEMIELVCGGPQNVVYTGYTSRLILNPAVITALLQCATEIGFSMRFVSPFSQVNGAFGSSGFNFQGQGGLNSNNVHNSYNGGNNNNMGNVLNTNNFFGGNSSI
jgi:hypothetical protein